MPVPAPAPITVAPSPGPAPAPENGGTPPSAPRHLPEKVLEMYNMLIGITTELERIKYELAKREAEHCTADAGAGCELWLAMLQGTRTRCPGPAPPPAPVPPWQPPPLQWSTLSPTRICMNRSQTYRWTHNESIQYLIQNLENPAFPPQWSMVIGQGTMN